MWRNFAGVLLTLALAGCMSPGLIGPLPTVLDKDNVAEIIVIRGSHFPVF